MITKIKAELTQEGECRLDYSDIGNTIRETTRRIDARLEELSKRKLPEES